MITTGLNPVRPKVPSCVGIERMNPAPVEGGVRIIPEAPTCHVLYMLLHLTFRCFLVT